jgi:hypothetical protein
VASLPLFQKERMQLTWQTDQPSGHQEQILGLETGMVFLDLWKCLLSLFNRLHNVPRDRGRMRLSYGLLFFILNRIAKSSLESSLKSCSALHRNPEADKKDIPPNILF